jgi:hypothetical protein
VRSDVPLDLLVAAMEAIGPLTGTEQSGFDFTIYTGDLTAHDPDNSYSRFVFSHFVYEMLMLPDRAYVEYEEVKSILIRSGCAFMTASRCWPTTC